MCGDVWRWGGNPDAVDYDHIKDDYYDEVYSEDSASAELRRMRRANH